MHDFANDGNGVVAAGVPHCGSDECDLDPSSAAVVEGGTADLPTSPAETTYSVQPVVLELDKTDHNSDLASKVPSSGPTLIPKGWTFVGDITSADDLELHGQVTGNIESTNPDASIVMGESCTSNGSIKGKKLLLRGTHNGNIDAAGGSVRIEPSAQIDGNVIYSQIQMMGGRHAITLQFTD